MRAMLSETEKVPSGGDISLSPNVIGGGRKEDKKKEMGVRRGKKREGERGGKRGKEKGDKKK